MAGEQEIQQLELLCRNLYEATIPAERAEAEKFLYNFQNSSSADTMGKCRLLLERGVSVYAQLLASSTLTRLISRATQVVTLQERIQMKNYILNYLLNRGTLDSNVIRALVLLYGRIVKNGWFETIDEENEDLAFQKVVKDVQPFLQGTIQQCTIGIQLLSALTSEMSQHQEVYTNTYLSKQRKISISFKHGALLEIFDVCHATIKMTLEKRATINFEDPIQLALISETLALARNCFINQLPSNWKAECLESAVFQPFIELYVMLPIPLSSLAMGCLVEASALGKCCCTDTRQEFVNRLLAGVLTILKSRHGLNDPANYHEFCKLIDALKNHYQIGTLVTAECYPEFIELLAKLTVESLTTTLIQAPNSVHFLLQFWQNMSSSLAFLRLTTEGKDHELTKYIPEISKAYISARLDTVPQILNNKLENPLNDETVVEQEMDQLKVIGRCDFAATFEKIVPLFDTTAQAYQDLLRKATSTPAEITLLEEELTWLVYMMGASLDGRLCYYYVNAHDANDADLACRIIRLMQLTDLRLTQAQLGCEHLEMAYLAFYEKFRRTCMGDNTRKALKVYERMKELIGVEGEAEVYALMAAKSVTNLKYWSKNDAILSSTIDLLDELSTGNNSNLRKFIKLEQIQFILNNHTGEHLPFLGLNKDASDLRLRTKFYKALGRFMIIDSLDDKNHFVKFMAPFAATLELLGQTLSNTETQLCKSEETKWTVVGLVRDLRGIMQSFQTRPPYLLFFEWIYPAYLPILDLAIQLWCHDADVTTPLLKFFIEMVQNRNDRLYFGEFSPNSVVLFREISKAICAYGSRGADPQKTVPEQVRLKETMLCFKLMRTALCSHFVNFGVMRFYNDDSVDKALACFIKLAVTVTLADLVQNPKLAMAYYGLLRCVAYDHMKFLCTIDPNIFLYILQTAAEGTVSSDINVSVDSAAIIDSIICHLYDQIVLIKEKKAGTLNGNELRILQVIEQHPEALQQSLATLLNIVLFENCTNTWAMAKPLLGLILLNEEYYGRLRTQLIANQPADKQSVTAALFENLFESIERNLSSKNKDQFIFNLVSFRRSACGGGI